MKFITFIVGLSLHQACSASANRQLQDQAGIAESSLTAIFAEASMPASEAHEMEEEITDALFHKRAKSDKAPSGGKASKQEAKAAKHSKPHSSKGGKASTVESMPLSMPSSIDSKTSKDPPMAKAEKDNSMSLPEAKAGKDSSMSLPAIAQAKADKHSSISANGKAAKISSSKSGKSGRSIDMSIELSMPVSEKEEEVEDGEEEEVGTPSTEVPIPATLPVVDTTATPDAFIPTTPAPGVTTVAAFGSTVPPFMSMSMPSTTLTPIQRSNNLDEIIKEEIKLVSPVVKNGHGGNEHSGHKESTGTDIAALKTHVPTGEARAAISSGTALVPHVVAGAVGVVYAVYAYAL